jgi:alpha-1,3-glucosyltransferase
MSEIVIYYFKDKVANFWCCISVVVKLKELYTVDLLSKISLLLTLISVLPSCINLFLKPTRERLTLCLVRLIISFYYSHIRSSSSFLKINSALGFFLFSFQVHEKSILLATM